jgi:hypothetical protein
MSWSDDNDRVEVTGLCLRQGWCWIGVLTREVDHGWYREHYRRVVVATDVTGSVVRIRKVVVDVIVGIQDSLSILYESRADFHVLGLPKVYVGRSVYQHIGQLVVLLRQGLGVYHTSVRYRATDLRVDAEGLVRNACSGRQGQILGLGSHLIPGMPAAC